MSRAWSLLGFQLAGVLGVSWIRKVLLIVMLAVFSLAFVSGQSLASSHNVVGSDDLSNFCVREFGGVLGLPTWYKYLDPEPVPAVGIPQHDDYQPPECRLNAINRHGFFSAAVLGGILLAVFEIIVRVGALIAVGFVIFGGFRYMLSQGEPDKTKAAKNTIIYALVGLSITMLSVALVNLVMGNIL